MKKLSVLCGALLLIGASANSQNIDERDVTVTMDLQSILQLDMSTSDQLEFVFDDVSDYFAGITQYGATQLRVSSTVDWDLYAIGRSNDGEFWDNQARYGSSTDGSIEIPLSALELRQSQPNQAVATSSTLIAGAQDYSLPFLSNDAIIVSADAADATNTTNATAGTGPTNLEGRSNSIYYNAAGTAPDANNRYIAGHKGTSESEAGGSYLNQSGTASNYFYVIDYRIVPGLPAVFPNARGPLTAAGMDGITVNEEMSLYAQPGVYSMYVQYILLEDQ
jgi:hypothetical protein